MSVKVFQELLRQASAASGVTLSYNEETTIVQSYEGGSRRVVGVTVWAVNVFGEREAIFSGRRDDAAAFLEGVAAVFRVAGGFRIKAEGEGRGLFSV